MPSFRAVQEIRDVRLGHAPTEVIETAVRACEEAGPRVEARDIEVIAGRARIWLRFSVADSSDAEEDAEALEVGAAIGAAVHRVALAGEVRVDRRTGPRWTSVGGPLPRR